ncbi:nucleotidyl transferase AbiEii/AbiGii toxin family protein [Kitasatospora phosalacinea]|uniref:Nucleotidyl transferase AbiEii/AbiGii toxin family protein n=1 Tax=Kitasatospora phosalacinea TaxID=2065 RepID=A0ABW6GIV6_9ACTN
MAKTYSPSGFQAALKQAARKASARHGLGTQELMSVFYFSRLAARVFTHDPDGWLIKGGQALLIRYAGEARLSRDLDLQTASAARTVGEAVAALTAAAALELDDHLRFVPGRGRPHADESKGAVQSFDVYLGLRKVSTVKVDIVVGRACTGKPEHRTLASIVGLEWPVDWPDATLYPVIDHVADKICAMYEIHPNGPSGRYRDLADLLLISQRETLDGLSAQRALVGEAARRSTKGTPVGLPDAFVLPDSGWNTGYPSAAALVIGLRGCRDIPTATSAAEVFVNPLLSPAPLDATWDPVTTSWNPHAQ